jgi:predicted DCC family thiol-disulfide oxidoreductase YuxK
VHLSQRLRFLVEGRVDARRLGVIRAGVGTAALIVGAELAGHLSRLAAPDVIRLPVFAPVAAAVVPGWWILLALWMLAAAGLAFGWHTRSAGVVLAGLITIIFLTDQQLYSNHLYLLGVVVIILTLADAGAAFSLDASRRARSALATSPAWGLFLIRLQVSVVYGFSALAKLNAAYLSGSVMASYLRTDGLLAIPPGWRSFQAMFVLSVLAVALEGLLAVGLWIPRWRRNAFVGGLALHTGIFLTFEPMLPFAAFGLLSLSLYPAFLNVQPGSRLVIWDRACGFCGAWIRAAQRLDWLGALTFAGTDEAEILELHGVSQQAADQAMHVIDADGTWRGFDAVRRIAEILPLSFLWAPLLALPPVRWLGGRAYASVARRRRCTVTLPDAGTPAGGVEAGAPRLWLP